MAFETILFQKKLKFRGLFMSGNQTLVQIDQKETRTITRILNTKIEDKVQVALF